MEGEDSVVQERSVAVPLHRMRLIKQEWLNLYTPIVEYGKLQIRFNLKDRTIDIRTCNATPDPGLVDRAACFIQAVMNGFKDIRKLKSSHLSRAIGRIIGRNGRIKESIENFSRCKFVLRDQRVYLLGGHENIKLAKDGIGRLVQGSDPESVFNRLRIVSAKLRDATGGIETIYDDLRQTVRGIR